MPMIVVVCVKQIPDPADPGALDPETRTLRRDAKLILDESDSYGVEMGLQLVDAAGEGEVRLVSMVPRGEVSGLRTALAMGAESAVLVSDEALAGSDALSTAKVLARAIQRCEPDLVLTATESSDGYTGTVPVQIAELLDLLTFPESWIRLHAKLELKHRDGDKVQAAVERWVQRQSPSDPKYIHNRLEALWAMRAWRSKMFGRPSSSIMGSAASRA